MKEALDLTKFTKNKEVVEAIKNHLSNVKVEDVIDSCAEDFVFQEETIKKIYAGIYTTNNVILYGPGGFGKSVLIKHLTEKLGIPTVYKVCHKDMSLEELFGIPNISKLMQESTFETAFENSLFAQPGILILEELFDARPEIIAGLKDVLTEKGFREKGSKKESLISSVIVLTNKNPDDLATDDSLAAFFVERFPIKHNVVWKSFKKKDYLKFLRTIFKTDGEVFDVLAYIFSNNKIRISPRRASQITSTVLELGIEYLNIFEDIDCDLISEIKSINFEKKRDLLEKEFFNFLKNSYQDCDIVTLDAILEKLHIYSYVFSENNKQNLENVYKTLQSYFNSNKKDILKNSEIYGAFENKFSALI
jgi:energy-coupling factor transporter ATP-binding protein EcfA2